MATAPAPWPCPVCAELVTVGFQDCPYCHSPAGWIDLIRAFDFSIRHFHYCSLMGAVPKPQYRQIVDACRLRREQMVRAAQEGQAMPSDTGLPARSACWHCQQPCNPKVAACPHCGAPPDSAEARLFRYQTYLCREIQRHEGAGHLSATQATHLLTETAKSLSQLRSRLAQAP